MSEYDRYPGDCLVYRAEDQLSSQMEEAGHSVVVPSFTEVQKFLGDFYSTAGQKICERYQGAPSMVSAMFGRGPVSPTRSSVPVGKNRRQLTKIRALHELAHTILRASALPGDLEYGRRHDTDFEGCLAFLLNLYYEGVGDLFVRALEERRLQEAEGIQDPLDSLRDPLRDIWG